MAADCGKVVEVRTIRISDIRDKEKFLLDSVGGQRREKALRFYYADDRFRCLAAGYLMKQYLPGFSEKIIAFGRDGKPFLPGGVPFSISHGGNYVVLAWCEGAEGVGVDVEPIRDMEYYRPILPRFMTMTERSAAGDDARKAVYIWTRKESLYKCIGEGISDFSELPEVLEDDVNFCGMPCRLKSWEKEEHIFSSALRNSKGMYGITIKEVSRLTC